MSRLTTQQVRSTFIDYFVKNGHTHVSASPLIPHNDPSLMFVNSGMVQFKNVFTGQEARPYTRATTSQKSVRAGGKHNDLDNVGYTARHHTFFEMLGNFSFGDYFKEEAIYYAWNLLTKEFGLPKEKLYTTVYHTDDEASSYWKKIAGLSDDRIIRINTNDNFWSMGDTGPCGPCSEIFYDHGDKIPGGLPGTQEQDGDRYIEIWNMVFMQFEQVDKDTRIALPKKSIDTGMGLERVSAVLQGVHDNYDIDLFRDIICFTESKLQTKAEGEARFSYRVIADHLRSCAFLIADGVMPSNEGRGYVLRRIMRRAMRHAHQLGSKEPLMYQLVSKLVDLMGQTYPELKRAEDFITSILEQEEVRFKTTLERGLKLLEEEAANLSKGSKLPGEVAFKLYDTYGFPLDLTEDILKKKEVSVDLEQFDAKMDEQRERARRSWAGSGESKEDRVWFDIKAEFGSTEFLGYMLSSAEGKVCALVSGGQKIEAISTPGEEFYLVANQTPFYGESGGQMGDVGIIFSEGCKIKVLDTKKYLGSLHVHSCRLGEGKINAGDNISLEIATHYRKNLKAHHSATHILHAVLRETLGKHIVQKGSMVAHDRLRFDISHPKAITPEEVILIEDKVNDIITDNSKVQTVIMPAEDAIKSGAMALFGEKYDNEVRVVSMGVENLDGVSYSIELCGGTHVSRTGDIGSFKIVSENAIAAGVRRIEAVCGEFVTEIARQNEQLLNQVAETLKGSKAEILDKVSSLVTSKKELERELARMQLAELDLNDQQIKDSSVKIGEANLIYKLVNQIDPKVLRSAAEAVSQKAPDLLVVYISNSEGKLSIMVAVSSALSSKVNASDIARELSLFLGGTGGGGKPTLAQSGGIDNGMLPKLQDKIKELLVR
jgi:alanyl-tRNA synthetase